MGDAKMVERAQERLAALRIQRDGIERKMEDVEAFIRMYGEFDSSNGAKKKPSFVGQQAGGRSLADFIVSALKNAPKNGLSAKEVAEKITKAGYQHRATTALELAVSSKLSRMAKKNTRGVKRVSPGRFALLSKFVLVK